MWTSGFNRYKNVYTYRSQEFRTSSKNYAINLDSSYYLFIKKTLNMQLNMILIVLMEFEYIRYSFLNFTTDLMNTMQFK